MPYKVLSLSNPFLVSSADDGIIGRVSGRINDIVQIISGSQRAIILTSAPKMGKTVFVRYLCSDTGDGGLWREELEQRGLADLLAQEDVRFTQISRFLKPIEGRVADIINNTDLLLVPFLQECYEKLSQLIPFAQTGITPRSLAVQNSKLTALEWFEQLQEILYESYEQQSNTRFFVVIDAVDRLALSALDFSGTRTSAETKQEQGIAILDRCGIIRCLVDLLDAHRNFGVILSVEALPRSRGTDQFVHVSADLARFASIPLQIFPWEEAEHILAQAPEAFGTSWAETFYTFGKQIFTNAEQHWLREQAGSHPYLLRQCCLQLFHAKQLYMSVKGIETWPVFRQDDKQQVQELLSRHVSAFLAQVWKRLEEGLEHSMPDTRTHFQEFVEFLRDHPAETILPQKLWTEWGPELRYLLQNEGIVRYDVFKDIYLPGRLLRDYFIQQINLASPGQSKGFWLTITSNGIEEQVSLSELEYRLLKTLLQSSRRCSEEELMRSAWGRIIDRSTFSQRMYHLRKKLRERSGNQDVIANHYGGQYSVVHPEWLRLE